MTLFIEQKQRARDLRVFLLFLGISSLSLLLGIALRAALDAASAGSTEGRGGGKVDVLLAVDADHERGDVNELLSDAGQMEAEEYEWERSSVGYTGNGS